MAHTNLKFLDNKLRKEKDYWSQKLSGTLVTTGLPLDYPRPEAYAGEKRDFRFTLGDETVRALLKLSGGNTSLAFAVLIAAQKICLFKYTGVGDVVVGTTAHERYSSESSLNKILALRDQFDGATTCKQLLPDVKRTLSEAYAHQKYPFDRVLDLVGVREVANRAPLFDTAAILDTPQNRQYVSTLKNDVTFAFLVNEGVVNIQYNPQLFNHETIEFVAEHYRLILRGLLDNPDAEISNLGLLTSDKERRFTVEFNDTAREYPRRTLGELFEAQVGRTPEAVAIVCGGEQVSYAELNARANRLARRLRGLGVGPESRVAVMMERSVELVVALLGVLKAGGAYVPLDPEYPVQRLGFMLDDCRPTVLLTQVSLREALPETAAHVIVLDEEGERARLSSFGGEDLPGGAGPDNLAYVIYTSGSTGRPKGVGVGHASLTNYLRWAVEEYAADGPADFALYSSLSFDLTVTSLFTPLLAGGRVIVFAGAAREGVLDDVVGGGEVGVLKLTPSHLRLLVAGGGQAPAEARVRRLVVGGEALPTELARRAVEYFGPGLEVCNEYGPTEATVGCMLHRYGAAGDAGRREVPAGRPGANARVYVLDAGLRPVAEGVGGELYVGGGCLARGYLGRPALTAERFVPDPFAAVAGARMYRTGDVARRLAGGEVEYVGRGDGQIKVRGVRVELGELRAALNEHPEVRDSVVVVRRGADGEAAVVCYYVSRRELGAEVLREHLRARVVSETVPEGYVHLRRLPLTLNGKVDEAGLPAWTGAGGGASYVEPRAGVEASVAGVWREVLGAERVGARDNFFESGGHSLRATQVISRLRETFQVNVTLGDLFAAPTVQQLAEKIEEALIAKTASTELDEMLAMLESLDEEEAASLLSGQDGPA